jgi:hypothetical protein
VRLRPSRGASLQTACCAIALLSLCPLTGICAAQAPTDGSEQTGSGQTSTQSGANIDFLFGRPKGSVGIRSGWMFARTASDLFDFVQSQLTIGHNDFNAPALAVDIGATASRRVDVLFGFEYSRATINSEYRHFVDNNRLPITQRTQMQQMNLSASAKIALIPRGREVGRLAWIPRPVAPYVGGGAGFLRYTFEQSGDFVDFVDLSVFGATLRSSGWTPSTHVFAGADIKLRRRLFLTAEARYLWAKAALGQDFTGFDRIDLSGAKVTAGVNFLF